jgi:hypothetical protein
LYFPLTRGSVLIVLVAFLFAVTGVGTWGEGVTYSLPIVFIVSYILVRRPALTNRLESLEAGLVVLTTSVVNSGR